MVRIRNKVIIKINLKTMLVFMLSSTLFIDYLNGVFPLFKIGIISRIVLIIICFMIALKYNKNLFGKYICICLFLITNTLVSIILNGMRATVDITYAMKTMLFFLIATSLVELFRKHYLCFKDIEKILSINIIYGPALYLVSFFMGDGRSSYTFSNAAVGFKSNFLSLNSLNIALLVMYMFSVSKFFTTGKGKWGLASGYVAIPLIMLGTKTSLILVVACPIIFMCKNIKRKSFFKGLKYIVIGILLLMPIILPYIWPSIQAAIERQLYMMGKRDIWTYLFSTRNVRLIAILEEYFRTFTPLDIIIGRGYFDLHHFVAQYLSSAELVLPIEMDFFDIFFSYGIPGLLFTYVYSVKAIVKAIPIRKNTNVQSNFVASIIILGYGILAGHLFQEAISSTFYALCIAQISIMNGERNYDKREKRRNII